MKRTLNLLLMLCIFATATAQSTFTSALKAKPAKGKGGAVPRHLQNKHFDGADNGNPGQFYKYPHSYPNRWVEQQYLPDDLKNTKFYEFGDNKTEQKFKEYWDIIKRGSR